MCMCKDTCIVKEIRAQVNENDPKLRVKSVEVTKGEKGSEISLVRKEPNSL